MPKSEKTEEPEDEFLKVFCEDCGFGLAEIVFYDETKNPRGEVFVQFHCDRCGNKNVPIPTNKRYGVSPFWVETGDNPREDYVFTSFISNRIIAGQKEIIKVKEV